MSYLQRRDDRTMVQPLAADRKVRRLRARSRRGARRRTPRTRTRSGPGARARRPAASPVRARRRSRRSRPRAPRRCRESRLPENSANSQGLEPLDWSSLGVRRRRGSSLRDLLFVVHAQALSTRRWRQSGYRRYQPASTSHFAGLRRHCATTLDEHEQSAPRSRAHSCSARRGAVLWPGGVRGEPQCYSLSSPPGRGARALALSALS